MRHLSVSHFSFMLATVRSLSSAPMARHYLHHTYIHTPEKCTRKKIKMTRPREMTGFTCGALHIFACLGAAAGGSASKFYDLEKNKMTKLAVKKQVAYIAIFTAHIRSTHSGKPFNLCVCVSALHRLNAHTNGHSSPGFLHTLHCTLLTYWFLLACFLLLIIFLVSFQIHLIVVGRPSLILFLLPFIIN